MTFLHSSPPWFSKLRGAAGAGRWQEQLANFLFVMKVWWVEHAPWVPLERVTSELLLVKSSKWKLSLSLKPRRKEAAARL